MNLTATDLFADAAKQCTICGAPVPPSSRGQTCSYSCRARLRERRKTSEWRRPREYDADIIERVRHLYVDRQMTRAEVQAQIGPGVKVEVIISRLGIARPAVKRNQRAEANDNWRGDAIEYHSAHNRVRALYGPASAHLCCDCKQQAVDCSYDGGCPRELTDEQTGCTYSPDPERYSPRCKSCHIEHDRQRDQRGQFTGRA
jgi:hypothetical protein